MSDLQSRRIRTASQDLSVAFGQAMLRAVHDGPMMGDSQYLLTFALEDYGRAVADLPPRIRGE